MTRTATAGVAAAAVALCLCGLPGPSTLVARAGAAPTPAPAASPTLRRGVMPIPGTLHPRSSAATTAAGPHLSYWGGHVVSSVQVIEVLYGNGTYEPEVNAAAAPSIGSFYSGVTSSPYVDWMGEYGTSIPGAGGDPGTNQAIGRGTFLSRIKIIPSPADDPSNPANNGTISDTQVQTELTRQIRSASLPPPSANTLYAMYFPSGVRISMLGPGGTTQVSGVDFCAYHGTTSNPEAYYSVLPDFNTGGMRQCGTGTEFQRATAVSAHELVEVITDPEVGLAQALGPPLGWYDAANNQEAADLCEANPGAEVNVVGGDGRTYTVQASWSNHQNGCVVRPGFSPQGVGAPSVAVDANGTQVVFWRGADGHLAEAWYTGGWNGPADYGGFGALSSAPSVAFAKDGSDAQVVFWQGPGGHLMEAWYANGWNGPVDWTASAFRGTGVLASAPSVATIADGRQVVFWRGTDGHLWEAWYSAGWHGPVDYSTFGTLASAPTVAILPGGSTQIVFWQGTDNHLVEAWFSNGWNGPVDLAGFGPATSAPTVAVTPDGASQMVFWRGPSGHLTEAWYAGGWNGPVDHPTMVLASPPSVALTPDGATQVVFWQGAGSSLDEAWYAGVWNGPVDYSG